MYIYVRTQEHVQYLSTYYLSIYILVIIYQLSKPLNDIMTKIMITDGILGTNVN